MFFHLDFILLILPLPLLGLGCKSNSLSPWFCVRRPSQCDAICWEFDLSSGFFVDCLNGWNQWMWLVSCSRQGMLTQGSSPDSKCKWNISSFLTLAHSLDSFICAKDIMTIESLLPMMWDMLWFGWGTGGGYYILY